MVVSNFGLLKFFYIAMVLQLYDSGKDHVQYDDGGHEVPDLNKVSGHYEASKV